MSDSGNQCDQMARLFFSIFGRLNSEILPYCIYFAKVDSKFYQLLKAPQTLPNVFKFRPIWSHCGGNSAHKIKFGRVAFHKLLT